MTFNLNLMESNDMNVCYLILLTQCDLSLLHELENFIIKIICDANDVFMEKKKMEKKKSLSLIHMIYRGKKKKRI